MLCALVLWISSGCFVPVLATPVLEGRVDKIEHGEIPALPQELLSAGISHEGLPEALMGSWYGAVEIAQVETYPHLHAGSPYWTAFIGEATKLFVPGNRGKVVLLLKRDRTGAVRVLSSDVILRGRMKLQFTSGRAPALVPGGWNNPTTITDVVRPIGETCFEQTRVDEVDITNATGMRIQNGFSEISATYTLVSPRKMSLRILEVDYNESGKPLWKVLIKGTATR